MSQQAYCRAREIAMANGRAYHLAAILRRNGMVVRIGENTYKTHPRFKRQYADGTWGSHMHAEMNVLRFAQPGDEVEVMRFRKRDRTFSMAKPCCLCTKEMKASGIIRVRYTNWEGSWEEFLL